MSGSGAPASSGTLTKATGTGDATLTFSQAIAPLYLHVKMVGAGGSGREAAQPVMAAQEETEEILLSEVLSLSRTAARALRLLGLAVLPVVRAVQPLSVPARSGSLLLEHQEMATHLTALLRSISWAAVAALDPSGIADPVDLQTELPQRLSRTLDAVAVEPEPATLRLTPTAVAVALADSWML
jgi:hypothetical protein